MTAVNVFGAGAFGTALAVSLANSGQRVHLIARQKIHADAMASERVNSARLPGIEFPPSLRVGTKPLEEAKIQLIAVPLRAVRDLVSAYCDKLANRHVIACCKGIEMDTGLGPTGIIKSVSPTSDCAALSGPSFAVDIGLGLPTALTLAADIEETGQHLQTALHFSSIRLYRSTDILGVELGGALKNVVALAAGITMGAGLGESARAALMTRGFQEIQRFALNQGAQLETLFGLSGFGDLVLTCTSLQSRNFNHGVSLGKGRQPDKSITVEGVGTAMAVSKIARTLGIDMPITTAVSELLTKQISVNDAIAALMARPLKKE